MSLFEGLRFSGGDTPIHRLDPRAKFVLTASIFTAAVLYFHLLPLLIIFLIQLPIVAAAKVWRGWLRTLRGGLYIAVLILVTNLISFYFYKGRVFTLEMVEYSLSMTLRFIVLVASFSIFFLTTSPDRLSLALEKLRIPYEFTFAFITAIRFVPVLAEEAQSIIDAQRARGLELERGGLLRRVRNYIPILLPLIVNSIRRSLELAEAMESRAFGAVRERTNLYELEMGGLDYVVLMLSIALMAIAIYIRVFHPNLGAFFPSV
ncbi:energy-coupling factor transporter transmembrane protein EcfT [Candidatus Bathyarchaeota archaeon]|nr:energy-coupling factor transporter transmembrane protein EcfT [Candidatus Bathyarchaeota archaeon]